MVLQTKIDLFYDLMPAEDVTLKFFFHIKSTLKSPLTNTLMTLPALTCRVPVHVYWFPEQKCIPLLN